MDSSARTLLPGRGARATLECSWVGYSLGLLRVAFRASQALLSPTLVYWSGSEMEKSQVPLGGLSVTEDTGSQPLLLTLASNI